MELTDEQKRTFEAVLSAALKREQCPKGIKLKRLADLGYIRVEHFPPASHLGNHMRVATILKGEHAGKATSGGKLTSARPSYVLDARPADEQRSLGLIPPCDLTTTTKKSVTMSRPPPWK